MMNGLSLFSGYGGIDLALSEWVRPIMYCDIEPYAQGIILSRMDDGSLPFAPIWNDVTTMDGTKFRGLVDFVYGGFPCQDISVAGNGAGLEGKRSGLFYEIARLANEIKPTFLLLENVPAIRTRGALEVQERLASLGYDTRWITISAAEVGANHKRERFFCLVAHTERINLRDESWWSIGTDWEGKAKPRNNGKKRPLAYADSLREQPEQKNWEHTLSRANDGGKDESLADANGEGLERTVRAREKCEKPTGRSKEVAHPNLSGLSGEAFAGPEEDNERIGQDHGRSMPSPFDSCWWSTEPNVGRVANGVAFRMDRIKALGNGVVPLQVKTAFEILMGIKK